MKKLLLLGTLLVATLSFGQSIYVPGGFTSSGIGVSTVSGNVGIGTWSPAEKLTVTGNISVNPNPNSKIGFYTNDSNLGLNIANYGMTFSSFAAPLSPSGTGPGVSLSGYYGLKFYTTNEARMVIADNGNIGVGTSTPSERLAIVGNSKISGKLNIGSNPFPTNTLYSTYQLFVKGGILKDEVRVALSTATGWADYVFAKDYNLKPLSEVEKFINDNGHLPNVPSAAEVKQDGIALGDMSRIQQEKIEELTLYIIAQNKRLGALEAKMNTTK